jgi:hypothetical protein
MVDVRDDTEIPDVAMLHINTLAYSKCHSIVYQIYTAYGCILESEIQLRKSRCAPLSSLFALIKEAPSINTGKLLLKMSSRLYNIVTSGLP